MKKKIIFGMLILAMLFTLVGCSEDSEDFNDIDIYDIYENTDYNTEIYGRFIILSTEEYYKDFWIYHYQSIAYDKDTKIMYIIDNVSNRNGYQGGTSISPYYVMNENNEPVVGVYNGDKEWEE